MEFRTPVSIPKASFEFSHTDEITLLGSCFVEYIGSKLQANKFRVDINPFGVVYNPASVASSLLRMLCPERFSPADLFRHEGVYHSFAHHSRFSSLSEREALEGMNRGLAESSDRLANASRLVITFGTAYVYRLKKNGQVVSNCHKLPEKMFDRELLPVDAVVSEWKSLLLSLWEHFPELKVLFTVSPVRHARDGAHGNQLSKSTLLLSIHQLQSRYPERVAYFPAYELMMDDLRDYRFYAGDMLHPSSIAVDYIWQQFGQAFFSSATHTILREWQEIQKAIDHKPFQPESEAYRRFIMQTLLKAERLTGKFPYFSLSKEMTLLKSKLK
ncbi:MAG: GSCFA domain-containing protein [Tannerellaceae bacterium]|jgi:hypothetical protein|nr:GSCFA domain-containing protein [Tannerellaceae bacterium]